MSDLIPILDTHQHLIYPDKWPYSWTNDIPALAGKAFTYNDYVNLVDGLGVAGTIFMETSPDGRYFQEETKFVYSLSEQPGSLIQGVISNCRPEDPDGDQFIDSIEHPKLVGFRRILHVMPDELSRSAIFEERIDYLGFQHYTFDMCFLARQLPLAIELATQCPDTQLILDHCGVPDIAAGAIDPWRAHIKALSKLPNVACKISGLLAYCKPDNATLEAVKPYVHHVIECFGADRCVWGSDWPVVVINSSLPEWIGITQQLLSPMSATEQRKVLHDNAIKIYQLVRQ